MNPKIIIAFIDSRGNVPAYIMRVHKNHHIFEGGKGSGVPGVLRQGGGQATETNKKGDANFHFWRASEQKKIFK